MYKTVLLEFCNYSFCWGKGLGRGHFYKCLFKMNVRETFLGEKPLWDKMTVSLVKHLVKNLQMVFWGDEGNKCCYKTCVPQVKIKIKQFDKRGEKMVDKQFQKKNFSATWNCLEQWQQIYEKTQLKTCCTNYFIRS